MCGCDFPLGSICDYHRATILDLVLKVRQAEADDRRQQARILRDQLKEYGRLRVAMVEQDLDEGGEEFARTSTRRASGSVHA
jgi:hypothetical protein